MKAKTKNIVILLVVGLVFPSILNYNFNFSVEKTTFNNLKNSSVYNGGILINASATTNTTYSGNWTWAVSQPWCHDDNGVYIIEDLTINASTSPTGSGIYILDSINEYFIIRNCTVFDAGSGGGEGGIKLINTNNGILFENNCSLNKHTGIYLSNVNNSQLINNNCSNNVYGIAFNYPCYNSTISGNTANNNDWGIFFNGECYNSTISGNTACNNNDDGIYIYDCYNSTISGNTANNNDWGIYFNGCYNSTISGNTASDNPQTGIHIDGVCYNSTISGNTANDNTDHGIYLNDCDYNTILGNTACNNTNEGIYLEYGENNNITGDTVNGNSNGIYLYDCDNNNITGNTANNNDEGIHLDGSDNNTISGNILDRNQDGIFIYVALNNTFIGNTIRNNVRGVHIDEDSDYNIFTENLITNNTIGVNINSLNDNNLVYKNFFLKNGQHAFDGGTDNKWNSTTIGNYWDNHTGPDTSPPDGIVDDEYTYISGSAGGIDYLPIAEDGTPTITINSPNADERFGIVAPSFNVEVTDVYVYEMWYTLDGGLNNYTFTENGTINQVAWDQLPEGSVTITFYAIDIIDNIAFEEVTIIKEISAGGLDPGIIATIVVVSIAGVLIIIGVAYMFLQKRRAPS